MERITALAPVDNERLQHTLGTTKPTREQISNILLRDTDVGQKLWESIGRGQASYITVYRDGTPVEVFICGVSFD